jgi:glycosyltransferase involved in cell wall biosynthesis
LSELACHFLSPREFSPGGLSQALKSLSCQLPCVDQPEADVLVAVGWHTPAELALLTALPGQRRVLWSHGLATLILYRARPVLGVLRLLSRVPQLLGVAASLRRCDCLVVAYPRRSRWDERSFDVVLARWLDVPVVVIGNPVDTDFWHLAPARSDQPMGSVVSMGRMEWQKGHGQALSIVLSASEQLRMQILAPESSSDAMALHRQAQRHGQPGQLQVLLGLEPEQRRQVLQQALCLLSWSETEYQSLAMLEALACGCPVVARPRGWLCHGPIPGVLVARSRWQAKGYIQRLEAEPAWREELGAAGRAYVQGHHGLRVVAQQWIKLFAELA